MVSSVFTSTIILLCTVLTPVFSGDLFAPFSHIAKVLDGTPHNTASAVTVASDSVTCTLMILILLCILLGIIVLMIITIIRGDREKHVPMNTVVPPTVSDTEVLTLPDPTEQPALPYESPRH